MAQLADAMTKGSELALSLFMKYLRLGNLRLVFDPKILNARKRAQQGLDILAERPPDQDMPAVDDVHDDVKRAIRAAKYNEWAKQTWRHQGLQDILRS